MDPKSNYWCPYKRRGHAETYTHTQREDEHMKREADIGGMIHNSRKAMDCYQPPKGKKKERKILL